MRPGEGLLQLLQLEAREGRPVAALLSLWLKLVHPAVIAVLVRHRAVWISAGPTRTPAPTAPRTGHHAVTLTLLLMMPSVMRVVLRQVVVAQMVAIGPGTLQRTTLGWPRLVRHVLQLALVRDAHRLASAGRMLVEIGKPCDVVNFGPVLKRPRALGKHSRSQPHVQLKEERGRTQ